jgi:hypothetical protein
MSSLEQRQNAIVRAKEVRMARARVKRELRERRIGLADALAASCCSSMTVFDLLCVQWRWARDQALNALAATGGVLGAPIPENKTVASLTDRQKRALLQACGGESEPERVESNQRVVVLTDEGIRACIKALAVSTDGGIAAGVAEAELTAALESSRGVTDEMVGNMLNELRGFDAGDEQDWIDARRALEAALFPGDEQ